MRWAHTAVWTGSEMIVWAGTDPGGGNFLQSGGRYDPRLDVWTSTSLVNVPSRRISHTAVWTGNEMIVWGGYDDSFTEVNTGGRYNPITDAWTATSLADAPSQRSSHTAVWTGSQMIIWSGYGRVSGCEGGNTDGGRYEPITDSWTPTSTTNAPVPRSGHTAVWTGNEMIVWGGEGSSGAYLNTGGRYCAQSGPTSTPTPTATASATMTSSPTPTATSTSTPSMTPNPSATATASASPAQALNLSTRLRVLTDANVGIGGFIITGTGPKQVLLRGIGPSLSNFGVPDPLADPVLELHGPSGFTTIINDNWMDDPVQKALIIASGLAPTDNLESAIVATLSPGQYTGILKGKNNGVGVGLVEVYDLAQAAASKLGNISTRGLVATGGDIMIAGFILGGNNGADNVIVRGIGPSLTAFGVPDALADPTLELRNGSGTLLVANNNWQDDPAQAAIITAAGLAPTNNLESAIAATLAPGLYTTLLAGLNSGTGLGLVEVYDLAASGPVATPTPGGTATPSATPAGTPSPTPAGSPSPSPTPAGPCVENWDSVTAPALPRGWVASNPDPGDGVLWATTTAMSESAPNNAFIPDQDGISDKVLDRTGVQVTSASATLSFRNNFNTEMSGGIFCDAYVLEVSAPNISGGEFLDITDLHVGGSFVTGGYNVTISTACGAPLAGRMAWAGSSNGYIDTVVNLGPNLAGQTVTFRFRIVTDEAVGAPGVHIDNLVFTAASCP